MTPAAPVGRRRIPHLDDPTAYRDELLAIGLGAGLDAAGITAATAWPDARRRLEERKAAGLHAGMRFTYGDPARATDPRRSLPDAQVLLVGARSYRRLPPPPVPAGPTGRVARYAWVDHGEQLRVALKAVAWRLKSDGWRARVLIDDNGLVDREAAHRAGLGWFGKNANLLLPGRGSWFVLGAVLTSAPLPVDATPVSDGCGGCRRCLDGCPTGAILAPGVVDARRCLSWLLQIDGDFPREHRQALGARLYGCDDCQEVCPPNRRADEDHPPPPAEPGAVAEVPILDLLAADDGALLDRHGRWYVPRRDPDHLRRNALVVLGNTADPVDGEVLATLDRYLAHPNPVLRAHAAWACRRLGREDRLVGRESDEAVAAELAAPAGGALLMRHLLVTNDFPPKLGGIQSYLWELWRRLPADDVTVLTTPHQGAAAWDAEQTYRVVRDRDRVLLPTPGLRRRIDELATAVEAELVLLDPALPVGALGPQLAHPYGVVLHGAEITVPGRLPGSRFLLRNVLRGARLVVAAGGYPLAEAERAAGRTLPSVSVPPGVDVDRFAVLDPEARAAARRRLGLPPDATVVLGLSRLVPRKGFDTLLRIAGRLAPTRPDLLIAIGGSGRDRKRLEQVAGAAAAPVRFLGRVDDDDLPALYGAADVFAMLCRNRWGGLEQEGFGIVFLEAAAAGVPQLAGRSGGSHEAVVDGETGFVAEDEAAAERALARLVDDPDLRRELGAAGRTRVAAELTYDVLAARLSAAIDGS